MSYNEVLNYISTYIKIGYNCRLLELSFILGTMKGTWRKADETVKEYIEFDKFLLLYKPAIGDIIYCDMTYEDRIDKKKMDWLLQLLIISRKRGAKIILKYVPSDRIREWTKSVDGIYINEINNAIVILE